MKLKSSDLRPQCSIHRRREPCFVCEKHETITEAHHVMPLKDVARILSGCGRTMREPPIVWLCPNCHTYLHGYHRGELPFGAFSAEELRRVFQVDDIGYRYLDSESEGWLHERTN